MNKTHILCILVAFVLGFAVGKSLSIYRIERGPSWSNNGSNGSSRTSVLKVNTITGKAWRLVTTTWLPVGDEDEQTDEMEK
jgi:hypothetical protein